MENLKENIINSNNNFINTLKNFNDDNNDLNTQLNEINFLIDKKKKHINHKYLKKHELENENIDKIKVLNYLKSEYDLMFNINNDNNNLKHFEEMNIYFKNCNYTIDTYSNELNPLNSLLDTENKLNELKTILINNENSDISQKRTENYNYNNYDIKENTNLLYLAVVKVSYSTNLISYIIPLKNDYKVLNLIEDLEKLFNYNSNQIYARDDHKNVIIKETSILHLLKSMNLLKLNEENKSGDFKYISINFTFNLFKINNKFNLKDSANIKKDNNLNKLNNNNNQDEDFLKNKELDQENMLINEISNSISKYYTNNLNDKSIKQDKLSDDIIKNAKTKGNIQILLQIEKTFGYRFINTLLFITYLFVISCIILLNPINEILDFHKNNIYNILNSEYHTNVFNDEGLYNTEKTINDFTTDFNGEKLVTSIKLKHIKNFDDYWLWMLDKGFDKLGFYIKSNTKDNSKLEIAFNEKKKQLFKFYKLVGSVRIINLMSNYDSDFELSNINTYINELQQKYANNFKNKSSINNKDSNDEKNNLIDILNYRKLLINKNKPYIYENDIDYKFSYFSNLSEERLNLKNDKLFIEFLNECNTTYEELKEVSIDSDTNLFTEEIEKKKEELFKRLYSRSNNTNTYCFVLTGFVRQKIDFFTVIEGKYEIFYPKYVHYIDFPLGISYDYNILKKSIRFLNLKWTDINTKLLNISFNILNEYSYGTTILFSNLVIEQDLTNLISITYDSSIFKMFVDLTPFFGPNYLNNPLIKINTNSNSKLYYFVKENFLNISYLLVLLVFSISSIIKQIYRLIKLNSNIITDNSKKYKIYYLVINRLVMITVFILRVISIYIQYKIFFLIKEKTQNRLSSNGYNNVHCPSSFISKNLNITAYYLEIIMIILSFPLIFEVFYYEVFGLIFRIFSNKIYHILSFFKIILIYLFALGLSAFIVYGDYINHFSDFANSMVNILYLLLKNEHIIVQLEEVDSFFTKAIIFVLMIIVKFILLSLYFMIFYESYYEVCAEGHKILHHSIIWYGIKFFFQNIYYKIKKFKYSLSRKTKK